MRPRIPYFNFYPVDFIRGVRGLTAQEVGIYTMLLCRIYEENGPVAANPVKLAAYCGCRQSTLESVFARLCLLDKIYVVDGMFSNERADQEIEIRNRVVKSNSIAGKLSAEKRKQNQGPIATTVERNSIPSVKNGKNISSEMAHSGMSLIHMSFLSLSQHFQ